MKKKVLQTEKLDFCFVWIHHHQHTKKTRMKSKAKAQFCVTVNQIGGQKGLREETLQTDSNAIQNSNSLKRIASTAQEACALNDLTELGKRLCIDRPRRLVELHEHPSPKSCACLFLN